MMKSQHLWRSLTTPGRVTSQARDLLMHLHNSFASDAFARAYRTVRPYTMSGDARLRGLYQAIQHVAERRIPGAVVECGTARGGSAALLGLAMKTFNDRRPLWVFDTFEGIPPPTTADPDYEIAAPYTGSFRGDLADVTRLFERLDMLENARFVKGRFEDTVPQCDTGAIAVLHVDGDWYKSVKVCLDHLYDRVSPGGVIQIDDYGHWEGARKAVDEFLLARRIAGPLRYLDYTGRQLIKQEPVAIAAHAEERTGGGR
jgi:predicted O-methyltransferase YrrM